MVYLSKCIGGGNTLHRYLDITKVITTTFFPKGCSQIAKAMSVPSSAILGGLLILTSFVVSPAVVTVPGTDWVEPTLIWLTISMPTGSRKTTVYQFLKRMLQDIRREAKCKGKFTIGGWGCETAGHQKNKPTKV